MKTARSLVAAALAGCSVSQAQLPASSPPAGAAAHARTWMSRNASAKPLLYISDYGSVNVYDYETNTQVGSLEYFQHAGGSCTDAHGNVYITNTGDADILEFSHGATKPKYIVNPYPYPVDCSIDPSTGNLAVVNEYGEGESSPGNVAIYAGGNGKPKIYKSIFSSVPLVSASYDASGNLLVSAYQDKTFDFARLPAGKSAMESVTLPRSQNWYGPPYVRWDGEYFVVEFETEYVNSPAIFVMYTITGSSGLQEGYSLTERAGGSAPFWLGRIGGPKTLKRASQLVLCGDSDYGGVEFFDYPEGGAYVFEIQNLEQAGGATVSLPAH